MSNFASNTTNVANITDADIEGGFGNCAGDGMAMDSAHFNAVLRNFCLRFIEADNFGDFLIVDNTDPDNPIVSVDADALCADTDFQQCMSDALFALDSFNVNLADRILSAFSVVNGQLNIADDHDAMGAFTFTPCPATFPFSTNAPAGSSHNITISTANGTPYTVDWGDGTAPAEFNSGDQATHTYAAPFGGNVIITYQSDDVITEFTSTQGNWDFSITDLPQSLITYNNSSPNNVTSGNIAGLPTDMQRYNNSGQNTTSGDIANLPVNLILYVNNGQNTTTGDIANLPSTLTIYQNSGQNTTSGDIATLPTGLTQYTNNGQNTTTGDIATLPSAMFIYVNGGQNTTTGDIANLPAVMTSYRNNGQNTTTGDIANLPPSLRAFETEGLNTTFGSINSLPASLIRYINLGLNTTNATSNAWSAATTYQLFGLGGAAGTRSDADIDLILSALENVTTWSGQASIGLSGASNGAPTAAGLASIAVITANGAATIVTN